MLDINFIRENSEEVKEGIQKKNVEPKIVDRFLRFDKKWRSKISTLDDLRAKQNEVSKQIAKEKKEDLLSRAQVLKKQISKLEDEEEKIKAKRSKALNKIPNIPFNDVTVGKNESNNVVVEEIGEKPDFDFEPKGYMELGEKLNLINTKKAAKVSGARFGYLLNEAALLEFGLIQLAFEVLTSKGFAPVIPPVMIRPEAIEKMGKAQFIKNKDAFYVDEDDLYLAGTSEHTIGPYHMNDKFKPNELPQKYAGFSTCFRREAGSYGKDTKGIFRVHQFDKVEMLVFSKPEDSEDIHKEMVQNQKNLMKKLELPYRVVEICTGDMGWADARQFDIETWFPSQKRYRETQSCSNTTDFQARGINAKMLNGSDSEYIHMLNGTAFAIGRTIIALIENNQTKDGTVKIPEALQEYVGKEEIK